jgi:hypothetical protein
MLTIERLKEVLEYNPDSGVWTWIGRTGEKSRSRPGKIAGWLTNGGYVTIQIDRVDYMAHRLAWFYMTGSWPKAGIDHKNCIESDNRWINLREATHRQNHGNRRRPSNNESGYKDVSWHKRAKKWVAQGGASPRRHLGYYVSKEEAAAAYIAWAKETYGEFSRDK